jgi:hypothetical protein
VHRDRPKIDTTIPARKAAVSGDRPKLDGFHDNRATIDEVICWSGSPRMHSGRTHLDGGFVVMPLIALTTSPSAKGLSFYWVAVDRSAPKAAIRAILTEPQEWTLSGHLC